MYRKEKTMTTPTVAPATATVAVKPAPIYMTRSEAEDLLESLGLPFIEQSGFIKVALPGARVYIAATKTIRRVDLSGFTHPTLGKTPHCGEFGAVKQQLILGTSAQEALANLEEVLRYAAALPAPAPKVKAPKAKKVQAPAAPAPAEEKVEAEVTAEMMGLMDASPALVVNASDES